MSIDDYNRHATFGPLAGPPTNASQLAGQQAYDNAHRPVQYGPAQGGESGPPGEIPKFLREGALRRGLWTVGIAVLVSTVAGWFLRPGSAALLIVTGVTGLAFLAGIFLTLCGLFARAAQRRKEAAEATEATEASTVDAADADPRT